MVVCSQPPKHGMPQFPRRGRGPWESFSPLRSFSFSGCGGPVRRAPKLTICSLPWTWIMACAPEADAGQAETPCNTRGRRGMCTRSLSHHRICRRAGSNRSNPIPGQLPGFGNYSFGNRFGLRFGVRLRVSVCIHLLVWLELPPASPPPWKQSQWRESTITDGQYPACFLEGHSQDLRGEGMQG